MTKEPELHEIVNKLEDKADGKMKNVVREDANEVLEALIDQKGLKKGFIAKKLGMSPQNLANLIHRGKVKADLAFKVSKVLDVNPRVFLNEPYSDFLKK